MEYFVVSVTNKAVIGKAKKEANGIISVTLDALPTDGKLTLVPDVNEEVEGEIINEH